MKLVFILILIFSESDSDYLRKLALCTSAGSSKVSFVAIIDIEKATKDGIYLGEYIVNIPYDRLIQLNGKTVRISGKVTVIKGVADIYEQGRATDRKHILKPKIKVLDN